jgi:hypothetical protein
MGGFVESMGNLKRRGHLEDVGTDGRMLLKWILKVYSVYRVHLVQDRDQQQVLGSLVMSLVNDGGRPS